MKNYLLLMSFIFVLLSCEKEELKLQPINENSNELKSVLSDNSIACSYCDSNNPIGGGSGYGSIINNGNITIQPFKKDGSLKTPVELGNELVNAIANPKLPNNFIIFIEPGCTLEVQGSINITKSITIASNRGNGVFQGALIRLQDGIDDPLFNILADNVRITGLRLEGHEDYSLAIQAYGNSTNSHLTNIKIDNNEFYNWADAIRISEVATDEITYSLSENAFNINNNYFHNIIYADNGGYRGYPIMVWKAFAKIYANKFVLNRHDVVGVGSPKSGYEVYCNIFNSTYDAPGYPGRQSNIDMHGDGGNAQYYAGGFMHIHHNDFRAINPQANIFPVGRPETLCLIDNNFFKTTTIYSTSDCAIQQTVCCGTSNNPSAYGNVIAINNIYNNSYLGWYVREQWDKNKTDNFIRIPSSNDLLHSNNYANTYGTPWIQMNGQSLNYYFGDFNGDGITDIFKSENNAYYYLPLNTSYNTHWIQIPCFGPDLGTMTLVSGNDHYKYVPNLIFGNFDNDNTTDIFKTTGTNWYIKYGNIPNWTSTITSTTTINQLLFGKFKYSSFYDNMTDVLFPNGNIWQISFNSSTSWYNFNEAYPYQYYRLKTGDFNGDGYTDVFYTNLNQWYYQKDGTTYSWYGLANSNLSPDYLEIGDFNSDQISDVIGLYDNNWRVSLGGVSSWQVLNTSNFPLYQFQYGNLH